METGEIIYRLMSEPVSELERNDIGALVSTFSWCSRELLIQNIPHDCI